MYENAKIYKLVCGDLTYYGSTCGPLNKRKAQHNRDYKCWIQGKKGYITSFKLFENGEPDIVLVEDFSCDRKEQLHARERYYIENNECVNKFTPTQTNHEWYVKNKKKIIEQQSKSFVCECGVVIKMKSKSNHIRFSKFHAENIITS